MPDKKNPYLKKDPDLKKLYGNMMGSLKKQGKQPDLILAMGDSKDALNTLKEA